MTPLSHDFLKQLVFFPFPPSKLISFNISFISDYDSHAMLPGLRYFLLSPQSLLIPFVSEKRGGESKQFTVPPSGLVPARLKHDIKLLIRRFSTVFHFTIWLLVT
jgi:hypothetical protein